MTQDQYMSDKAIRDLISVLREQGLKDDQIVNILLGMVSRKD